MEVPEIQKPANVTCPDVIPKGGCGVYKNRPGSCKSFQCLWLSGEVGVGGGPDTDLRPDKLGLMFSIMKGTKFGDVLSVWEVWPDASRQNPGRALIEVISSERVMLILQRGKRSVVGPPHEMERVQGVMTEINEKRGLPPLQMKIQGKSVDPQKNNS